MRTFYRTAPGIAGFQPSGAHTRLVTNVLEPPPFSPPPNLPGEPPEPAKKTSRARLALGCGLLIVIGLLPLAVILIGGQGASSRCTSASASLIEAISEGLSVSGSTLGSGYVVKSDDYDEVYFVAAPISGPGVGLTASGTIGVWASSGTEPGQGTIFSVNSAALEWSDWPDGTTAATLSMSDDGASEARSCVR